MARERFYKGILVVLTLLFFSYGVRGYYPRYNLPLQEESPFHLPIVSEGEYSLLLFPVQGSGNPSDILKHPLPYDSRNLPSGQSAALFISLMKEAMKMVSFRDYTGTVFIDISTTDLIYPFHYFL